MEVVVIDKATFERMLSGFEIFAEKVERLCREQEDLGDKLPSICQDTYDAVLKKFDDWKNQ